MIKDTVAALLLSKCLIAKVSKLFALYSEIHSELFWNIGTAIFILIINITIVIETDVIAILNHIIDSKFNILVLLFIHCDEMSFSTCIWIVDKYFNKTSDWLQVQHIFKWVLWFFVEKEFFSKYFFLLNTVQISRQ